MTDKTYMLWDSCGIFCGPLLTSTFLSYQLRTGGVSGGMKPGDRGPGLGNVWMLQARGLPLHRVWHNWDIFLHACLLQIKTVLSCADNKTTLWRLYVPRFDHHQLPNLESTWNSSLTPTKGMLRFTSMEPDGCMCLITSAEQKDQMSVAIWSLVLWRKGRCVLQDLPQPLWCALGSVNRSLLATGTR